MKVISTKLRGVLIIEPEVHGDERGFFMETYQAQRYQAAGINEVFVQDNHSRSSRGVLRGLHAQRRQPQGKLVRCATGSVFDVAVDVDPQSTTFGQHVAATLSSENGRQLYVPPGYLHGFVVLSESADFEYKCTAYYDPADEVGVLWNDPALAIAWPIDQPIVSVKDAALPILADFA